MDDARHTSSLPFVDGHDHLLAELELLEARLRTAVDATGAPLDATEEAGRARALATLQAPPPRSRATVDARLSASVAAGTHLPLLELAARCDLDAVERELLVLALAPHLDRKYEAVFAYLQGDPRLTLPRLDLALALFAEGPHERLAVRARLTHGAPLLARGLLCLAPSGPEHGELLDLLVAPRRVVRLALALPGGEPILEAMRIVEPFARLPQAHQTLFAPVIAAFARDWEHAAVALVRTDDPEAPLGLLAVAAEHLRRPFLAVDLAHPAAAAWSLDERVRTAFAEADLCGSLLVLIGLDGGDDGAPELVRTCLEGHLHRHRGPCILIGRHPPDCRREAARRPLLRVDVPPPDQAQRLELWRHYVDGPEPARGGLLVDLARRYRLGATQIRDAAHAAAYLDTAERASARAASATLDRAARAHARHTLHDLAHKVDPFGAWDSLVLPPERLQQLHELVQAVRHRDRVFEAWGLGRRAQRSAGVVALFTGPSGTGKTLCASLVAQTLGLDLFRVDLAGVVSKYIGETERNLERIFQAAHRSDAVLFFDEADALFGKRTEVRDAHDRYANIETSYLLQRIELFDGVVLLASNFKKNLDDAFLRRLHAVVEFPAPDRAHRRRLWEVLLPPDMPVEPPLDLDFLAERFELTGGHITNAIRTAATLAAARNGAVRLDELLVGVLRELHKQGRVCSPNDFGRHAARLERALLERTGAP